MLVCFCLFPLPLGVWEGLRFVIVALPARFSYLFFFFFFFFTIFTLCLCMYYPAIFFFILDSRLASYLGTKLSFWFSACSAFDCGAAALSASFFPFGVLGRRYWLIDSWSLSSFLFKRIHKTWYCSVTSNNSTECHTAPVCYLITALISGYHLGIRLDLTYQLRRKDVRWRIKDR